MPPVYPLVLGIAGLASLLDKTVVFSFDRSGFERHARRFEPGDLQVDLRGRVCAVTGANSGIGFATARALAVRGAHVLLLCRSVERGERARQEILREAPGAELSLEQLDVAHLASVRAFVARFRLPVLDVLVNNAGVLPAERSLSPEGIETTFATNVVGPYLLTRELRDKLAAAQDGRLVTVSSGGMYPVKLALDDWEFERRPFDGVAAYAMTKRAEVVLSEIWAARLSGTPVTVSAMHPGWADTPSVASSLPRFRALLGRRLRTAEQGADTVVWLAASLRARGRSGLFWFDREPRDPYVLPFTREPTAERERLVALCEELASR